MRQWFSQAAGSAVDLRLMSFLNDESGFDGIQHSQAMRQQVGLATLTALTAKECVFPVNFLSVCDV